MIIDHFSTYVVGGAPTAARRLHDELCRREINSRFNFAHGDDRLELDDSYHQISWPRTKRSLPRLIATQLRRNRIRSQFRRAMTNRPSGLESFTMPELARPTTYPIHEEPADVVNLHWIANFIDYESFFLSLPRSQPVVWTLHDMNPMTGGCHYSNECDAFKKKCQQCPQIGNPGLRDVAFKNFLVKANAFGDRNLNIVAPSRWLLEQARSSQLFSAATSFHHIPYGLEIDTYRPYDKRAARNELGIDTDRFVVAFVAESIENDRKGIRYLLEALSELATLPVQCLILGGGEIPESQQALPPLHQVGFVYEPERQAQVYSAADVLLLPSLADNLPLTGLESLACGTPVIGFDVGGIPDYVRPGQTGLLAQPGDVRGLVDAIRWLMSNSDQHRQMCLQSRKIVEAEYSSRQQANSYVALYEKLLSESGSVQPIAA